ncbi:hypothetical protein LMG19282_04211 [Cupriavidus campinensis]|nr:hypothetical protein LMG19282_04211 [Cupriavidus campinensis]
MSGIRCTRGHCEKRLHQSPCGSFQFALQAEILFQMLNRTIYGGLMYQCQPTSIPSFSLRRSDLISSGHCPKDHVAAALSIIDHRLFHFGEIERHHSLEDVEALGIYVGVFSCGDLLDVSPEGGVKSGEMANQFFELLTLDCIDFAKFPFGVPYFTLHFFCELCGFAHLPLQLFEVIARRQIFSPLTHVPTEEDSEKRDREHQHPVNPVLDNRARHYGSDEGLRGCVHEAMTGRYSGGILA